MNEYSLYTVEATTALVRRAVCPHADLGPTIARLFQEIISGNPNAELEDAPRVYYREWKPDVCEIEVALPVSGSTGPADGTSLKTYPACQALSTQHVGPYENLHESWMRLYAVAQKEGMQPTGYPWDEFVQGPMETPYPAQWVTELYLPVGTAA